MNRVILSMLFFFFLFHFSFAQELIKVELNDDDKQKNVLCKYAYEGSDHYISIELRLYRDSTYYFTSYSNMSNVFSEGRCQQKNDTLILNSSLIKDNIPVKLSYSDSVNPKNNFKIREIANLQGKEMIDGSVTINNEKIRCFPSYRICNNNFESIDSIKIFFENKSSSEWLKITQKKYSQIIPIVQVDFMISNYEFFENKKYRITKSALEYIK